MQQNRPFSKKVPPDLPSAQSRTKKSPPARQLFRRRTEQGQPHDQAQNEIAAEPPPLQDPGRRRCNAFWQTFFESGSHVGIKKGALPAGPGRGPEQRQPHEQSRKRNRGRTPRLRRTRAGDAITFFGKPFFESGSYVGIKKGALHEQSRKRNRGRAPPPLQNPGKRRYKVFWQTFFSKKVCGTIGAGGMPFFTTISRNRGQYSR